MSGVQRDYGYQYETVAASQTAQVLGTTGAAGDYLHRLIVTVNTALTSTVTILDGSTSIPIVPANVGAGVGAYSIEINAASISGAWKVTTGAGVTVVAVGKFS
jgi:uncharacterized spore protein YtfJ